jgi:hypothetical protein
MKIRQRFNKELEKQPALSTWMAFVRSIKEEEYKDEIIKKNFYKLVEKEDYVNSSFPSKMEWLYSL